MRKSIKDDEIYGPGPSLFLFSTIACAQYIPVSAKVTDGTGNGAFAEAITRSDRADGAGISSCGDVCA